jgi:transcriptional regulator GlxA family with amidase domain
MPRRRAIHVDILVLEDCAPIVPVGMVDLLRKCVDLASTLPGSRPEVVSRLVSSGSSAVARAAGGVVVHCDTTLRGARGSDVAIVPALDPDILERLAQHRRVLPWLRRAFARGADVVSACTGSFLVAEAGLLDGRTATTHWAFQPLFAARYPKVRLAPQAILVDQGRLVTSGGATSFINLALFLAERLLGQDAAWAASKMFLIDPNKSPQGAYAAFSTQKGHDDAPILKAQEAIERDVRRVPSVDDLARLVALSRRTFDRRFQAATENSPRTYIQRVRVEAAKRALERGESVSTVAGCVGYDDVVAFRKLFVRTTGLTPADYRSRYGPKAAPAWERPRASSR